MRFVSALLAAAAAFLGLQTAAQATVRIHIDLTRQSMHVTSGAGASYNWPVSTGRPGYRTPTGVYRPQRMFVMAYSAKYQNAPMPHSIFFRGGYAIHGSYEVSHLGWPASHGCIRLAPGNATALFQMVKREGAVIVISGRAPGRDQIATQRERRYGGQGLAGGWRMRSPDQARSFAPPTPRYYEYERPPRTWSVYPLDGQ